eukprot:1074143-Amphidinium_carterae.1
MKVKPSDTAPVRTTLVRDTIEQATFISALTDAEFENMSKTFEKVKNYSKKSSLARAILAFDAEFKNLQDERGVLKIRTGCSKRGVQKIRTGCSKRGVRKFRTGCSKQGVLQIRTGCSKR